jgi:hypothetical protein
LKGRGFSRAARVGKGTTLVVLLSSRIHGGF